MTARFRIEQFRVETFNGPVIYDFVDDLTVLAGDTGVGKTTLFELIKFALGGDGTIAPVAADGVGEVHISVRVGAERFEISRELDTDRRKTVRVTDLISGDVWPSVPLTSDEDDTVSDILLRALGFSTNMRAAARSGNSRRKGALITFNDVFRFMYVPQAAINQDIAGSRDSYYDPKRKAVFELLFGLTDQAILRMQSEVNQLNAQVADAKREYETITQFLSGSGMQSRYEVEVAREQAFTDEKEGNATLVRLADEVEEVIDRETQILREMLAVGEQSLSEAQDLIQSLTRERTQYSAERHQVSQDIARLHQMANAGDRLANIEFVVCPRCTQSLTNREVPEDTCRVCLQPDKVKDLTREQYETTQLAGQVEEVDLQLAVIDRQLIEAEAARNDRRLLIANLTSRIEARTATRVTPRLQAYTDAATKAARAKAQQEALDEVLQRWDSANDLGEAADSLEKKRAALKADINRANATIETRRRNVLDELTVEFAQTVAAFRIPAGQGATIDPKTYLPLLDGRPYNDATLAGGIATATQVAYWISLLAVAVRLNDTNYPAFLLIDSPRMAVSSAEDITGQMYTRFVTQVGVTKGRLQFIVADNGLPATFKREFKEFKFSYKEPTISSIEHPGPANVVTLNPQEDSAAEAAANDID